MVTTMEKEDSRLKQERMRKLSELQELGIQPYPYRFERSHKASELHDK